MASQAPEYQVQCAMCQDSFSATADTLEELVKIVQVHLEDMKQSHDHNHQKSPYPSTKDEILDSNFFRWNVLRLQPFNNLSEACAKIGPHIPPKSRQEVTVHA